MLCAQLVSGRGNTPTMHSQGGALQDKFLQFAAYGSKKSETQLDGRSFVKLIKDAGLLKKPLTTTDLVSDRPTHRHPWIDLYV